MVASLQPMYGYISGRVGSVSSGCVPVPHRCQADQGVVGHHSDGENHDYEDTDLWVPKT
jgi:hypothetical protein